MHHKLDRGDVCISVLSCEDTIGARWQTYLPKKKKHNICAPTWGTYIYLPSRIYTVLETGIDWMVMRIVEYLGCWLTLLAIQTYLELVTTLLSSSPLALHPIRLPFAIDWMSRDSESETSKDKHMNLKKSWYLATRHPDRVQAVKICWKILENRLQLQWVPHVLWRCDADATERLQAGAPGGCLGGEIQHFDALLAQQVLRRNRPSSDDGMIWDDQFAVSIMGSSHKTIWLDDWITFMIKCWVCPFFWTPWVPMGARQALDVVITCG